MKKLILLFYFVLALIIAAALTLPANAQGGPPPCGDRTEIIQQLTDKYGETQHELGLAANGTIIEVYVNWDTGTWTILVTDANGLACMAAAGESWEYAVHEVPGQDG